VVIFISLITVIFVQRRRLQQQQVAAAPAYSVHEIYSVDPKFQPPVEIGNSGALNEMDNSGQLNEMGFGGRRIEMKT
jgi:hypothetical protein